MDKAAYWTLAALSLITLSTGTLTTNAGTTTYTYTMDTTKTTTTTNAFIKVYHYEAQQCEDEWKTVRACDTMLPNMTKPNCYDTGAWIYTCTQNPETPTDFMNRKIDEYINAVTTISNNMK